MSMPTGGGPKITKRETIYFKSQNLLHARACRANTFKQQHTYYTMPSGNKNIQKLTRIENEMMKSRQTQPTAKLCCEGEDDEASDFEYNDKINGLRTGSSCVNDILMKTLIAKYAQRLMDKLAKISVNVSDDSEHVDGIAQLCRKAQRLIKDLDQVGGPCDSSTVLLNKYDCLRMEYYSLRDLIKRTRRQQCGKEGGSVATRRLKSRENYEKIEKCKIMENRKKPENQYKRKNRKNRNNFNKQNNCCTSNEKIGNFKKLEELTKLEDQKKIRPNYEKLDNRRKYELCSYCGKRRKVCSMMWETRQRTDKTNCQKKPFEWKSFLKHRLFVYFPCLRCMIRNTD